MRNKLKLALFLFTLMISLSINARIIDAGHCGDHATYRLEDDGILYIEGKGDMNYYGFCPASPFYNFCKSILKVSISDGITSIGLDAFMACSNLTSITIPNSVTGIEEHAFSGCSSLTSICIPNSVTYIGYEAFGGCSSLDSVNIADLTAWCNIQFYSLKSNPLHNGGKLILDGKEIQELHIPNSVVSIGRYAFRGYSGLTSVEIPNSVTTIGDYAFDGCSSLTSVTIPNSATTIGNYAFRGCSSLTSVTIPNSVVSIGTSAFYGCSSLTSVTIPNSVTTIDPYAFSYCSKLTSINIPEFVTNISASVFIGCSSLTSINVDCNNDSYCSVSGVLFNSNKTHLIKYPASNKEISYIVPNSVENIGMYAFLNCSSITTLTIPNSVTSIGQEAFNSCSSLTAITFPNSINLISYGALYNCSNLTSITISNSVTTIGNNAFSGCSALKAIHSHSFTPPTTEKNTFYGVDRNTCIIYVPIGAKENYAHSPNWRSFLNIIEEELPTLVNVCPLDKRPIIVSSSNGAISLSGLDNNESVSFYSTSGQNLGQAKAINGDVVFEASSFIGNIIIAKIGDGSIKISVK